MKFKLGDKVRFVHDNGHFVDVKIGNIYEIDCISSDDKPYRATLSNGDYAWFVEEELELVLSKKPTKDELFAMPNGTRVTTDLNSEYNVFYKANGNFRNDDSDLMSRCDVRDDLTINDDFYGTKIIKIEKPIEYQTVYDCSTEIKEMTIADIEKALGHQVKIVKEAE